MKNMRMSKEEKEFRKRVDWILDEYANYLSSDDDDDPKPSPPALTKILVDKDKQVGAAIAIDGHHHHQEEDQEEYLTMKMKKSSEEKPPAVVDDLHESIAEFEGLMRKPISLIMPLKKRLFSECNQEEGEAMHNNKKIKNEISCCSANPPPEELRRKFTYNKNSSITKFEEPVGSKQISLKFIPPKKRLLSEYYQEEGETAMHNKKIKNEEISCCSANPPLEELRRKFTYNKNSSITKFEEPVGSKQILLKFIPPKKRLLSEYYQEEGEAAMHNKKIKNEEISCCSANPPPELPGRFIYIKNKAWGSSFIQYFVKENNFVEVENPEKKTDKKISTRDSAPNQPPPLPQKYREKVNAMGGSEPVLVIQKRLFKSDRTQQLNRLSIPRKQMMAEFLTDEEKENVKKNQLEVTLIDPRLVEWTLNVKEWNMNSSVYVLITNWYKLVVENPDLKEGTKVQLWSFRVGTKLCFVLVRLDC